MATLLNNSQLKPLNMINTKVQVMIAFNGFNKDIPKAKPKNFAKEAMILPFVTMKSKKGRTINNTTGIPTPTATFPALFNR